VDTGKPRRLGRSIPASRLAITGWLCGLSLAVAIAGPVSGAPPSTDVLLPTLPVPVPSLPLPTLPVPSLPLPTPPLPTLPLPTLTLPTPSLPVPSLPLPSLPVPSVFPSVALPGTPLSTPSPPGTATDLPSVATPSPSGAESPGSTSAAGGLAGSSQPSDGTGSTGSTGSLLPFEDFVIPGLLIGVPALVLLAIIALQVAGALAWLPVVKRRLGRSSPPWASHRRQP
jgi:hypothetical protein